MIVYSLEDPLRSVWDYDNFVEGIQFMYLKDA